MSHSQLAILVLAIVLPGAVQAQSSVTRATSPISAPVRDGGTLHVASATWTRKANTASLGADILYNNTCNAQFFATLSGDTYIDEGRVPGPSSPDNFTSKPGCASSYAVDGFQIAYCTDLATARFHCAFYNNYITCATVMGNTPTGAFALTGLPGAPALTTLCWVVSIDVSATPFRIETVGLFETNPKFAFSISSPQSSFVQGPIIAADPNNCSHFDGTSWDPVVDLAEDGTGMGAVNAIRIEGGPTPPGCTWFGGTPFASLWLEFYGTTCAPSAPGQAAFCAAGRDGATACPCANDPSAFVTTGCLNSFGLGARLEGTGVASLSADSVVLHGAQMPANSPVLYFQGTLRHNAGFGQVFGDGLRCAGGPVTRLGTTTNSSGWTSQYPSGSQQSVSVRGGVTQPGTRTYQAWYRNVATFCTPSGFNTSNGWEIFWGA